MTRRFALALCWVLVIGCYAGCDDSPLQGSGDLATAAGPGVDAAAAPRSDGGNESEADLSLTDGPASPSDGLVAVDAAQPPPLASDPGLVQCGAMSCTGSEPLCCSSVANFQQSYSCIEQADVVTCGFVSRCDEQADCFPGQICCSGPPQVGVSSLVFTSVCLTASVGVCEFNGSLQLCKTDTECQGGATCTYKKCRGSQFFSCGPLPAWLTCSP